MKKDVFDMLAYFSGEERIEHTLWFQITIDKAHKMQIL